MMKETKIPSNIHAMFLLDLKPPRVGYNIASCHNTIINTELISESRAKVKGSKETQSQMSQTSSYTLSLRTHAQIAKKPPDKRSCGHSPPRLMLLLAGCLPANNGEHGSSPSSLWSHLWGSKLLHLNFRSKIFFVAIEEFEIIMKIISLWLFKKINQCLVDREGVSAMVHSSTEPMGFYVDRGVVDDFLPRCQSQPLSILNYESVCLITFSCVRRK